MNEDHLAALVTRYMSGELASGEALELEAWADSSPANRRLLSRMLNEAELERELDQWRSIDPGLAYERWKAYMQARKRARVLRIMGWSVAASLLVAVVTGAVHSILSSDVRVVPVKPIAARTVLPGRNTATLTLSNGQVVLLDSTDKGELARQGNTRLMNTGNGSLSYIVVGKDAVTPATYNILTTPKSGQYQVLLPDGSRVWLNNVSSLRYPTMFKGGNRTVELTGEAYFEIAKDPARPFIVKVRDESVEVLGTSFNIMSYSEEGGTQTTLLSGAVRVNTGAAAVRLKTDEQSKIEPGGGVTILKDVPSQDIVSWKNGFFYFGRASFAAVMRQLARWYDVEVVYEGDAPEMEFGGKIDRSLPLDELLKFLDRNHIHFRLEGRKLIVLPS
jgi:transmembrane sensor